MGNQKRCKRIPVNLDLNISSLFKQDNVKIQNIDAPIEVKNISKTGMGFESKAILPLHYYFNAKICLGSEEHCLYMVVQIVRSEKRGDKMFYGCEFLGRAKILDHIFEDFDKRMAEME